MQAGLCFGAQCTFHAFTGGAVAHGGCYFQCDQAQQHSHILPSRRYVWELRCSALLSTLQSVCRLPIFCPPKSHTQRWVRHCLPTLPIGKPLVHNCAHAWLLLHPPSLRPTSSMHLCEAFGENNQPVTDIMHTIFFYGTVTYSTGWASDSTATNCVAVC